MKFTIRINAANCANCFLTLTILIEEIAQMEQSTPKVVFKIPGSVILHLRMTILSSQGTYSRPSQILVINLILKTKAEKQSKECLNHVLFKTLALVSHEFFHPF